MTDTFTQTDRLITSAFLSSGQYSYGYAVVANSLPNNSSAHTWFANAAAINAGVGPGSTFANTQTYLGYLVSGVAPVGSQLISDGIASGVLGAVVGLEGNGIHLESINRVESNVVVRITVTVHLFDNSSSLP